MIGFFLNFFDLASLNSFLIRKILDIYKYECQPSWFMLNHSWVEYLLNKYKIFCLPFFFFFLNKQFGILEHKLLLLMNFKIGRKFGMKKIMLF